MVVTLLTDFGTSEDYVGAIKGVILTLNPSVTLVDLSHEVPPGDVVRAGWLLNWAWPFFPQGTIHLVVVDPGVGTSRRILCLKIKGHLFLGPDNGVFTQVIEGVKDPLVYAVSNRRYALEKISNTFHGRDILAPAAGYLSRGLSPHRLGPRVYRIHRLKTPGPRLLGQKRLIGQVVLLDRFGNAITNISSAQMDPLRQKGECEVWIRGFRIRGIRSSYRSVKKGRPLGIIGSHDLLEIAVSEGSARERMRLQIGTPVEVTVV